ILKSNIPIIYSLEGLNISTDTGTLNFNSTMGNFTFIAYENSSWDDNLQTYLNVSFIRIKEVGSYHTAESWNDTHVKIHLSLTRSDLIENASFSTIHVLLPSDWSNLIVINQSKSIDFHNETISINDYIIGNRYHIDNLGIDCITLEAWGPNYFTNIVAPVDINKYEIIQIKGDLLYPLPGNINLFLHNNSFIYHQTTLPMINSTFLFSAIEINDQFPFGFLQLTLNWSNKWQYGVYEQLVYIHQDAGDQSEILFQSLQSVEIYQYEPLQVNLSLHKSGEKYATNSTFVFLINKDDCLFFTRSSSDDFILNSTRIIWEPGNYSLEVFASDEGEFFATETLNLTIRPVSIFWTFENLQTQVVRNESINFRIYSYLQPKDKGILIAFSDLKIRLLINDTIVAEYTTNLEGYTDIFLDANYSVLENSLYISLIGLVKDQICKYQSMVFSISNETAPSTGERANINELFRTQAKANKTFFIYYSVDYSSWYIPIGSFSRNLISAFILRDNFVIGTQIQEQYLIWSIEANQTSNDTLVLELPCPTVHSALEEISEKFRIKITLFSDITINNYSVSLDLSFLGFPFMNISLLDSLERDITNVFPITSDSFIISISQLNIISGIEINYFLVGNLQEMEIEIWKPFKVSYAYNESITGCWKVRFPVNFSYTVQYTIQNSGWFICYNTSLMAFSNNSAIITANIPPQSWNSSISVQLIVKYFSNLKKISSIQNFTITDPFAPLLDYSVESRGNQIRIYSFAFEPEKASGIKNISVVAEKKTFAATFSTSGFYIFEISMRNIDSQYIKINVIDLAENEVSSDYIDTKKFVNSYQPFSEILNPQIISSVIFSFAIISGIIIIRMIKKRKSTIL
ncbi:MAG: hypothetical protein ACFE8U_11760, partial [Candidatus Hermodarchaeota archaeon]